MSMPCPCGTPYPYPACCGPFIQGKTTAQTPVELMRSRYTAYTRCEFDYLEQTMAGKAKSKFSAKTAKQSAQPHWMGLQIIREWMENDHVGFVEFKAHYQFEGRSQCLYEISRFEKINETWLYVDGTIVNPG